MLSCCASIYLLAHCTPSVWCVFLGLWGYICQLSSIVLLIFSFLLTCLYITWWVYICIDVWQVFYSLLSTRAFLHLRNIYYSLFTRSGLRISWRWRHHHDYCIIVKYTYNSFVSMEFVGVLGCPLRVLATERRHVGMVYVLIIFRYVSFMSFPSVDFLVWSYWLLRLQIDLD